MTRSKPDPTEIFRNLVTEWERGFDSLANRIMGTEEFSGSMNQLQSLQLSMQKAFNEFMAQQLSTFNLPSREDVLRLGENLGALAQRVAHIEELLVELSGEKAAPVRRSPPRTRQPSGRARDKSDG